MPNKKVILSTTPPTSLSPLPLQFYQINPVQLAKKLIGKLIVRSYNGNRLVARIVETEAYGGVSDDPASHAYVGTTDRNKVMFYRGGYAYVYFTYGMHFCFNVVAGKEKHAGAVLIRAAEPIMGINTMQRNRNKESLSDLLSGPAKLCQALAINREHNGLRLDDQSLFIASDPSYSAIKIVATTRIGIRVVMEKKWRFVDANSEFLSVTIKKSNK